MKKLRDWTRGKCFDVAAGPMYLMMFGVPLLVILAVVGIVALAVRLIRRARRKDDHRDEKD